VLFRSYDTEAFGPIIAAIEALAGYKYKSDPGSALGAEKDRSLRIIADHIRTATFILGDPKAVMPSNVGAGYVLRRIIRRAVRHGRKLGIEGAFLSRPAAAVVDNFSGPFPELAENRARVLDELAKEEYKFL
jgi:alanyl-tRNA synthetase